MKRNQKASSNGKEIFQINEVKFGWGFSDFQVAVYCSYFSINLELLFIPMYVGGFIL